MTNPISSTKQVLAYQMPGATDWRDLEPANPDDDQQRAAARTAKEELKNTLLISLQMQHLVVLAGSGCSLSVGGPSMKDLWKYVIDDSQKTTRDAIAIKVNHDLKQENIEAFLSKVEAYLQITDDAVARDFLNFSKKVILDKCSAFLDPTKLGAHKTFLHKLSRRRIRDQRLKIFTTNYDLCFERANVELGGVALDGFSFTSPRRYDPRFFNYDIVRRPRSGEDLGYYLEGVFLFYKLHGSVNWARDQKGTIHEKDKPEPSEACLIYPATGKYQQSFIQPHLESMSQYLVAVREPNTCFLVVGFGFNDDHLAEPLLTAVESNPHLRLIIVDPKAKVHAQQGDNPYWKRLVELNCQGEDVHLINAPFNVFAERIPDLKSLTPAENLIKAIKGVARES